MASNEVRVLGFELGKVALGVPRPDAVAGKHQIHLLERALVGLGVQRPDGDDAEGVDGAKNVQRLFFELVKDGGQKKDLELTKSATNSRACVLGYVTYTPAVANGPADDAPSIALGADLERENLGGVQPRHGQPGGAENRSIEKHEKGCGAADLGAVRVGGVDGGAGEATGGKHADALANSTPVQSPAAADAVECKDTNQSGRLGHVSDCALCRLILSARFANSPCM